MKTKKCSKCGKRKKEDQFNWKNKAKGLRRVACKVCTREETKKHHQNHQSYYVDKARRYNDVLRKENQLKMLEYLKEHPCIDCGETHPSCLEFDHMRDKEDNVSRMMHMRKWESILKEISKCVVRCANCHRKKTAKDRGYYSGSVA